MTLELVGQDRPGIVREISHALALHKVNIEELHTETRSAPMSGDLLFHARATIRVPPSCSTQQLRTALEKIASDLMIDLSLGETETAAK
jgi:glycine cleavage system regulatory protein